MLIQKSKVKVKYLVAAIALCIGAEGNKKFKPNF